MKAPKALGGGGNEMNALQKLKATAATAAIAAVWAAAAPAAAEELVVATFGGSFAEDTETCHVAL